MIAGLILAAAALQVPGPAVGTAHLADDDTASVRPAEGSGEVAIKWTTSPDGELDCEILKSSGDAKADEQACVLLEKIDRPPEGEATVRMESTVMPGRSSITTSSSFSTPDEIDPAILPYFQCLIAANGHTSNLPDFPAPDFTDDGKCLKMRSWAHAYALELLERQRDERSPAERLAFVDQAFDAIDKQVPRN